MTSYRKKPVVIQAVQWTGDNLDQLRKFVGLRPEPNPYGVVGFCLYQDSDDPEYTAEVCDELHDTWVKARTGDWIIKGVKGEFYPCAADVFAATYDEVTT